MKSTDIAVFVSGKFARFVRPKQTANEVAGKVTGLTFKRGQHEQARSALRRWIDVERLKGVSLSDEVPFA